MKNILKRRGILPNGESTSGSYDEKLLTAPMCLGLEGNVQYIDPKQLLNFIDNARMDDVEHMGAFFALSKARKKFPLPRKELTDQGGNRYKYINFFGAGGPEGAKVVLIGNIKQLISDLHAGLFVIGFTLDELVELAEKV